MRTRFLTLLVLTILASSTRVADAAARIATPTPSPSAHSALPPCPDSPAWRIDRDTFGGSYIGNGWDNGFLMLLRVTAIGGNVAGTFLQVARDDDGALATDVWSVHGLVDATQVVIVIDQVLGSITMQGTWAGRGLALEWVGQDGGFVTGAFASIDDDVADLVIERWTDLAPRLAARGPAEQALALARGALAYPTDRATEPTWMSAADAAIITGMPDIDSLSLLVYGWLATAGFETHRVGNLPNQVDRFALHVTRSAAAAAQFASCAAAYHLGIEGFAEVRGPRGIDLVLVQTSVYEPRVGAQTIVIAIAGPLVVTADVYGEPRDEDAVIDFAIAALRGYKVS
jgi:hypothetical protein